MSQYHAYGLTEGLAESRSLATAEVKGFVEMDSMWGASDGKRSRASIVRLIAMAVACNNQCPTVSKCITGQREEGGRPLARRSRQRRSWPRPCGGARAGDPRGARGSSC